MNTSHTKCPWSVSKNHEGNYDIHAQDKSIVSEVFPRLKKSESEANALLIAAAPELLAAVMILIEDHNYDITLPIEGFSHRTQKVINAVKKATDKQYAHQH